MVTRTTTIFSLFLLPLLALAACGGGSSGISSALSTPTGSTISGGIVVDPYIVGEPLSVGGQLNSPVAAKGCSQSLNEMIQSHVHFVRPARPYPELSGEACTIPAARNSTAPFSYSI